MDIIISPIVWLILFIIFLIAELATVSLATIWFAIGSLAGLGVNLAGFGFWPQIITFLVVSFLSLVFTRPIAMKYFKKSYVKTNVDELPGREAIVTETINNLKGTGRVLLNGVDWRAITEDNQKVIEEGKTVEVLAVQGVKVIIKEKEV